MNYLIYDGVNLTLRFGLIISGAGTFSAPSRIVDTVPVPGRNGYLVRDDGYYANTELVYAGSGLRRRDRDQLEQLRVFLSRHQDGYYKLADSYHPDEYRMARFVGPFSPSVGPQLRLATFDLVFDCKPQRFLLSGDEEIELNYTTDATGGSTYKVYGSLTATEKSQVDALDLVDGYNVTSFPTFTLSRNAAYVAVKEPENAIPGSQIRWMYPNSSLGEGLYWFAGSQSSGTTIDTAYVSPFMSVVDDQGEIFTPSHYETEIYNPTSFDSAPIIKVYMNKTQTLPNCKIDTAFGVSADDYVTFDYFTDENWRIWFDRTLIIDCENYMAYSGHVSGVRMLNHNTGAGFVGSVRLKPGSNTFRISNYRATFSNVDKITLIPRWYRL